MSSNKRVHLISYADEKYANARVRIQDQAKQTGDFTSIRVFGPEHIPPDHAPVKQTTRGGGYWLWKPYIIKTAFDALEEGEYLVYLDAGCSVNKFGKQRFYEYLALLDNDAEQRGVISFQLPYVEKTYTTQQIFDYFNASEEIKTSGQLLATIIIFKKCAHAQKVVDAFYNAGLDRPEYFTDIFNKEQDKSYFIDNRHDQSILSVISKQMGTIVLPDETWYPDFNCAEALRIPFLATRLR